MAHDIDIGIELDRDRTVLVARTPAGEQRLEFPTRIGVGDDGIVVGDEVDIATSQRVFEPRQMRLAPDGEDATGRRPLLLTLFLKRVVETLREGIELEDLGSTSIDSTRISVPGSASRSTFDAVREAASAAGLENLSIHRRPTPGTILPLQQTDSKSTVLSVAIGAGECDLALYRIENGETVVLGRLTVPELGARNWSRDIAETILERVGAEEDARVEYSESSLEGLARSIRRDARDTGTDLLKGGDLSICHDMSEGATLTAGEHTLSEDVVVEYVLDRSLRYAALEYLLDDLVEALEALFEETGVDTTEVDLLVGSGDGYTLDVVDETITGFIESDPDSIVVGTFDVGAEELAKGEFARSEVTETLAYTVGVHAATEEGIQRQSLGTVQLSIQDWHRFELEPTSTTQQRGRFTISLTPAESDVPDLEFTVRLYGIPPASDDNPVTIPLEVGVDTPVDISQDDVDIRVDDPALAERIDVDVGGDVAGAETPPLRFPGHESVTLEQESEASDHAARISPITEAVENVETSDIARAVHEIRSDLWEWGVAEERSLDPSEIEILLREFDQRLSRYDIEFFVPDLGSTARPRRHEIRKQEPAEADEGSIIEVLKPGMEIDGRRAEPAVVTIASDTVPSPSDADEVEGDSGSGSDGASVDESE